MSGAGTDVVPVPVRAPVVQTSMSVPAVYFCRRTELAEVSGTDIEAEPNFPKCSIPVLMLYRTYRSVRYRYRCCTEFTKVFGTGMEVYTGTGGIFCRCTELTEVSDMGVDVAPDLPEECSVPVVPAIYTGGMPSYVPYRTQGRSNR